MHPYQQRVVDEKAELDKKLQALNGFIGTNIFEALPAAERARLRNQSAAMATYSEILGDRIAAFT